MNSRSNRKLHALMRVNELFMAERSEINANLMNSFYAAAMTQPVSSEDTFPTIKELSQLADIDYVTMSRNLRYLGDKEREGKRGMDLVRTNINPDNRREKQVFLTAKGEALRSHFLRLLD